MFEGVNGFFQTSPRFDKAVAKHYERFRKGRAIHLELGSYIVWPTERMQSINWRRSQQFGNRVRSWLTRK